MPSNRWTNPVANNLLTDKDRNPLPDGTVSFFEAGTSTPLAVYADPDQLVSLGSVLTADACALLPDFHFEQGKLYKAQAADANGVEVWTRDNLQGANDEFGASGSGVFQAVDGVWTDTSTVADEFVLVRSGIPSPTSYFDGQVIEFYAANDNLGAATLAISGIAAKPIRKGASDELIAGDILAGQFVSAVFRLSDDEFLITSLLPETIGTEQIKNGTIINEDLADDIIDESKIIDGSVTTNKIADNAITADKVPDNELPLSKIVVGSVTAGNDHFAGRFSTGGVNTFVAQATGSIRLRLSSASNGANCRIREFQTNGTTTLLVDQGAGTTPEFVNMNITAGRSYSLTTTLTNGLTVEVIATYSGDPRICPLV